MARYHLSPNFGGEPRPCGAEIKCDFADANDGQGVEHYDTKEEAQAAYERNMEAELGGATSTVQKTTKGADVAPDAPATWENVSNVLEGYEKNEHGDELIENWGITQDEHGMQQVGFIIDGNGYPAPVDGKSVQDVRASMIHALETAQHDLGDSEHEVLRRLRKDAGLSEVSNTLPATWEHTAKVLEEYEYGTDGDALVENWGITQDEHGVQQVGFIVEGQGFAAPVQGDKSVRDVRQAMVRSLEQHDMDSEYDELGNFSEDVEHLAAKEDTYRAFANRIRHDAGMLEREHRTLDQQVEHTFREHYSTLESDVPNTAPITNDAVEDVIDDYDLSHGNMEYFVDDHEYTITVEAPHNTTHTIYHDLREDGNTVADLRQSMARQLREFDGSFEFDELWNSGFSEQNNTTAKDFYVDVHADTKHFGAVANDIERDVNR